MKFHTPRSNINILLDLLTFQSWPFCPIAMLQHSWRLVVGFLFQVAKSSLHFSGGIEYGVIPDPTLIDQIHNGDFTIQAWFLIDTTFQFGEFSSILGTRTNSDNGFIFGISSSNGDTAPWIKLSENYVNDCCLYYNDSNWHHFIVVKNSSNIQFYIDGQSTYTSNNMYVLCQNLIYFFQCCHESC